MKRLIFANIAVFLVIVLTGCVRVSTNTAVTPEPLTTVTAVSTLPHTPTTWPMFRLTPTPEPSSVSVADIFADVSPAVAFIETPIKTGSGVLIEHGYIVTNAHVVWPFQEVRVVFPDGSEYPATPVLNWDLMVDLAVLGPLNTSLRPVALMDGEHLPIGSEVFLIGYPGELERFPQPTITRGLLSRQREWESVKMTYFQTDARVADGQSGGVLVSEKGQVIGISGLSFTKARFGLAASAADVQPQLERLITGEGTAPGHQRLPLSGGHPEHHFKLRNNWDNQIYVINEPPGTQVEIKVAGENDAVFAVWDALGQMRIYANNRTDGLESGAITTTLAAPYFVFLSQYSETPGSFKIESNCRLATYYESENHVQLTANQTLEAKIDTPGDLDYFVIELDAGDTINVTVDSIMIDPVIGVHFPGATQDEWVSDDNSGGLFGQSAALTYTAPHSGDYYIVIHDANRAQIGGYLLTVTTAPGAGATPTPIKSTPTPRPTPTVPMVWYESERYPFAIQYPVGWASQSEPDGWTVIDKEGKVTFTVYEEVLASKVGKMSLETYVDAFLLWASRVNENFRLISRRRVFSDQGLPIQVVVFTHGPEAEYESTRLFYVHQHIIGFNVTYTQPRVNYQKLAPIIDYSIATFQITK